MNVGCAVLDHIVVNTLHDMDAAAETFARLGFGLTPLGHHSLGSINHLMMTPGPYLELVGVPPSGLQRRDVLDSPVGLNGLVLKSDGADATYSRLRAAGLPALPPSSFSRPVSIADAQREARFRTVRWPPDEFRAGRVYFCEHLTPDYVWRDEWFDHPNGFEDIVSLLVEDPDPAAEAVRYALACDATATGEGHRWRVELGRFTIDVVWGSKPRFAALGLRFRDLSVLEDHAGKLAGTTWLSHGHHATLTLDALALRLECWPAT